MTKLIKRDNELVVQLSGDNFMRDLGVVKTMPGRTFDGDTKDWTLPATPDNAEKLMLAMRPQADQALLTWIKENKSEKAQELVTPLPDDAEVDVPWGEKLYDFQRAFVAWAADHPNCILADDMGLGKTFQAISAVIERFLKNDVDNGPKLIICPASVKGVWARELVKWLGEDEPFVVLEGSYGARKATLEEAATLGLPLEADGKPPRLTAQQVKSLVILDAVENNSWVIANWEQLRVHTVEQSRKIMVRLPNGVQRQETRKQKVEMLREPLFGTVKWQAVIADEAHRAKSRKSLQTRGLWKIDADMKLALSGTPIQNSPDELWPILRWLYPDEFGKSSPSRLDKATGKVIPGKQRQAFWAFFDMYVDSYESDYGKVITGARNPDALRFLLSKKLVRRTKGDKLDLPPKVRHIVPVTLGKKQRKLYDEAEKEMWLQVAQDAKNDPKLAKLAEGVAEGKVSVYDMPNGAVRTSRLRQIASTPALLGAEDDSAKLDDAVEIILDAQPKQIAVFTEFVGTCHALVERLEKKGIKAKAFTGKVTPAERTVLENQFQDGEVQVLVGTIKAMGVGITLTAADTAIFIERDWTPANNEQAEDRLWRNGQTNHVTIIIMEGVDTVDSSKVNPTNDFKSRIVKSVIQTDEVETKFKENA